MSSIRRPLAGPALSFRLADEVAALRAEDAYARSGRAGKTLAKSGRFRLVLTALADGHEVGTHQADSPLSIQVVEGVLRSAGGAGEASAGDLLFFSAGDAPDLRAAGDAALLLTLAAEADDYRPEETAHD